MNHVDATSDDLPELSDEDIELVHEICRRASLSTDPPFKALFAAYDAVFAEQQIEQEHDGVVFRMLLRVGETGRSRSLKASHVDLVSSFKSILQAQGITVVDDEDEQVQEVEDAAQAPVQRNGQGDSKAREGRRRVSFDDACLDETRLSEHTLSNRAYDPTPLDQLGVLGQPRRRGRTAHLIPTKRRARSISSERLNILTRRSAPKQPSPTTAYTSDHEVANQHLHENPTLLFQLSQTQMKQNADAFSSIAGIRSARRCLHAWHHRALHLRSRGARSYALATSHDRRTLLKQALDQWRSTLSVCRLGRRTEAHWDRVEKRTEWAYSVRILEKAFTHWATSSQDQKLATSVAQKHMLKIRYFRRWRQIAADTNERVWRIQSVLARKCLGVWRERVVRRQVREEQAVATYEETAVKRCWRAWFWHFCSRRVEGWHEVRVKGRMLGAWRKALAEQRLRAQRATSQHNTWVARCAVGGLYDRFQDRASTMKLAQDHHNRTLSAKSLHSCLIQTKLSPLQNTIKLRISLNLERKAFRIWHLQLRLAHQAADADRKRVLQSAWTSWNDVLRCMALGQRINERVLVESLYKWLLQERLILFARASEARLMGTWFSVWKARWRNLGRRLVEAEVCYERDQRRRHLAMGMVKLNLALRQQEDAGRAALELRNSHLLPGVQVILRRETEKKLELLNWAVDARFYTLATKSLNVWQEKTSQRQQHRRRDAYAHVRARIKTRVVRFCFARWRENCHHLRGLDVEAGRRTQLRLYAAGTKAFDTWREKVVQLLEHHLQAETLDRQKLMGSALAALTLRSSHVVALHESALVFRHETEFALLSSALKKVQWAHFTAARRTESAEALWARNRDVHLRNMVKVWTAQAEQRRAANAAKGEMRDEEPESPSLRPASRARSKSTTRAPAASPLQHAQATIPAYLRTPSRSRRAGRFRARLPTPAPVTPFVIDDAYLATTPTKSQMGSQVVDEARTETPARRVTPFARKLTAGGFTPTQGPPALRSSVLGRSTQGGTSKSVRFAGRFGVHLKSS